MKIRIRFMGMLLLWIGVFSFSASAAQSDRQVWSFYMGFWAGADSWNWQADVLDDYPAIGPYDSRDPGVAGTQIDQAKSAGIDAFVVSWFGLEDGVTTTHALNNMLDRAAERGFQVGAALDIFSSQFNRSRDAVVNSLNWLVHDRANHPGYLRYNGKPVIFFAFQDRANFSTDEWQSIRNQVDPDRNTIWIAEGINGCCLYGGAMDGMYAFNIAWANGSSGRYASERRSTLNAGGSLYIPMVHPGWDETKVAERDGRANATSVKNRADGRFLANSFNGAVASGAAVIMIGTWNEFVENSHIEPSQLYGTQSLDTLRPLIANWKGTASPVDTTETTETTAPASALSGRVAVMSTNLNVRATGTIDGAKLGTAPIGSAYLIIGEADGWYQIDFGGQAGWVSGNYITIEER